MDESKEEVKEVRKEEEKNDGRKEINLDKVLGPKETLVEEVLGGHLFSGVRCMVCDSLSVSFDPFIDISLEMPRKEQSSFTYMSKKQ